MWGVASHSFESVSGVCHRPLRRNRRRIFEIQVGIMKGRFWLADVNATGFPRKDVPDAVF